jgi:hypothetical protein
MKVTEGSKWTGGNGEVFIVIYVIEKEGNTWVHYRNNKTGQEYNCYRESFLHRFYPLPD